jgi:hypothetical protein
MRTLIDDSDVTDEIAADDGAEAAAADTDDVLNQSLL